MNIFEKIALQRIEEAMEQGEFDNLPGRGRPLDLSEDPFERPENRLANKILRNAGISPPEVSLRKELASLKSQLAASRSKEERESLMREIKTLVLRINLMMKHATVNEIVDD